MISTTTHLMETLKNAKNKDYKTYDLYCDIETVTTNRLAEKPTELQTYTYSFAIAYFDLNDELCYCMYNHFSDFFDDLKDHKIRKTLSIKMWFHNGQKYDNHFVLHDLSQDYKLPIKSLHVKNGINNTNRLTKKLKDITTEEKNNGIILEQRIRSSNRVDLTMFIGGRKVQTVDTYPKMNISLREVGKKLLNLNLIQEELLKTDFEYEKYDMKEPMTYEDAKLYTKRIYDTLNEQQLIYIRNDVLLLALGCKHYKELFNGFDINKMTFTQNIKEQYASVSPLSEFQLLKTYYNAHIAYGDYNISNMNGFDYFRRYYKGGLNLYNDKYLGKLIKEEGFSIDLNSSYPTVMYKEKLPSFLSYHKSCSQEAFIEVDNPDKMTFFTMTYNNANKYILRKIKSKVLKNALVKYYNSIDGKVYYNSVMLKLIQDITHQEFSELPIEDISIFDCEYFGGRSMIAKNYFIKTQGKMKTALNCTMETIDPTNIELTDKPKPPEYNFDDSLVQASKVLLNGIYGVPALRSHFDVFTRDEAGNIVNNKEGFENKERNIIFSAGVTAFAFRNLFTPLKYLTQEEIDEYFWYCDTDSLYMNKKALKKFPKTMFHKMNLGGWDIEHENITAFYPFNHKKYCLYDNGIVVRCGGVSKDQVAEWIKGSNNDIEYFINHYFSDGVHVQAQHSVRNTMGTISIYNTETELQKGISYQTEYTKEAEDCMEFVKQIAREKMEDKQDEEAGGNTLYIETPFGQIGRNELMNDRPAGTYNVNKLIIGMQAMKNILE